MNQRDARRPRRWRARPFDDLPPRDEATAWMLVNRWLARRHGNVPQWLYPKLTERAYKLVEDPSTPYRLAGAAGGNACARRDLGKQHPIHKVRAKMLNRRRTQKEEGRTGARETRPSSKNPLEVVGHRRAGLSETASRIQAQKPASSGVSTKFISVSSGGEVNKELTD